MTCPTVVASITTIEGLFDDNKTDDQIKQFKCILKEYLHHFVDARQKELGSAVDVTQFYFNAQTCSSIGTSSFEIALVGNLTKLYEQKVQDLTFALATVERLFDYCGDQGSQKKNVTTLNPENMISNPNPPTNFTNDKKPHISSSSTPRGAHPSNSNQKRLNNHTEAS
ncbi:uncharacterized protein E5676_scaffold24463G00010 [Cucumis melo var. makuwa]|uniref:Uncharacterized protein n=1 Tax=Cucumis melo var. makuwa TaxID=1194695 RepID=A0A5D3DRS4_CUCMM|nr:uncharacterized protein E5676_scaffold24463G00010 [Cucumis melo var. makuwa]